MSLSRLPRGFAPNLTNLPKIIPTISRERYLTLLLFGLLLAVLLFSSGCGLLLRERVAEEGRRDQEPTLDDGAGESLRAKATVEIRGSDGKNLSGKAIILARTPDLFRIEFLGPFNQTAALILSDGGGIYYYSKGRAEYHFTGDPGYPYPFTAAELVAFLFGERNGGMLDAGEDYMLDFNGEGRIEVLEKIKDGRVLFRASMGDFRRNGERWYPYEIVIDDGAQEISIRYNSLIPDAIIDSGLFIKPPKSR